ncbi:hypothetical protein [Pseudoalteromonas sp. APC 3224]|nr:hypothetical protein [Pseudoalteromonas sp. APC 3224]
MADFIWWVMESYLLPVLGVVLVVCCLLLVVFITFMIVTDIIKGEV